MKIGIYINGLGQSVPDENAINYASRLANEMNKNDDDFDYGIKLEKVEYTTDEKSTVVTILKTDKKTKSEVPHYKFYEFLYGETLTKSYNDKNVIYKNYLLFNIVATKFPRMVWRIIKPTKQYNSSFQTLYVFSLFLFLALAILLMIPTTISLFLNDGVINMIKSIWWLYNPIHRVGITKDGLKSFAELFVPIISLIMLIVPKANLMIASLATEFVSAHLYLQYGHERRTITGNLDQLYEYIANHETDPEIHIHAYSFGSLIALDYLYPYKNNVTGNTLKRTKALITIGTPYDFINTYYPNYYNHRGDAIESKKLQWINVYSIIDALASNFRDDANAGEATYGIITNGTLPHNIDYEVVNYQNFGFVNYMLLNNLKVHGMYWSDTINGQSCLDPIYIKMNALELI